MKALSLLVLAIATVTASAATEVTVTPPSAGDSYQAACLVIVVPKVQPNGSVSDPQVVGRMVVNVPKGGFQKVASYKGYSYGVSYYALQNTIPQQYSINLYVYPGEDTHKTIGSSGMTVTAGQVPMMMVNLKGHPEFECQDIITPKK